MKFKAKNAHNPVGYVHFSTQKLVKKTIFRTILPYLVVAKAMPFFIINFLKGARFLMNSE